LDLEKLSDENVIIFYLEELEMIDMGKLASSVLPSSVIRKLIRLGILKLAGGRGKKQGLVLSDKARILIEHKYTRLGQATLPKKS